MINFPRKLLFSDDIQSPCIYESESRTFRYRDVPRRRMGQTAAEGYVRIYIYI